MTACLAVLAACAQGADRLADGAQTDLVPQQYVAWARTHAHELALDGASLADARMESFGPLKAVIGEARLLAIGEPFHGGHEPLALRNRMIRYCITELGFTAVALETGLSPSKRLYDYVLGIADESNAALAELFSYGFGGFQENLELLHWLRAYNAQQPDSRRVRLYGVDMTGQVFPYAYRSLDAVQAYLRRADPALAATVGVDLADVVPVFRSDRFIQLAAAEQDRIGGKINGLGTLLRRRRVDLTAATSKDDYDWALRQAHSAAQDASYLRAVEPDWIRFVNPNPDKPRPETFQAGPHFLDSFEVREASIAENVAWVLEREGPRGRIVLFAHNVHLQGHPESTPPGNGIFTLLSGRQSAGMHIRSTLGRSMVVIGSYFGESRGFPTREVPLPPAQAGIDALLGSLKLGAYLIDLRELAARGPLADWFGREHAMRSGDSAGDTIQTVRPSKAFDAILHINRITPARK